MLSKENRLKNKKDFEKVFKGGRGYEEDFLYLKFKENNLKSSRFGFIVSKKFSKKAVLRNQARRKLREIIRKNIPKIKKNIDAVVIARPGLEISDFQKLEEKISRLIKKARII